MAVAVVAYLRVGRSWGSLRLVGLGVLIGVGGYVGDVVWHTNHSVAEGGSALPAPHLLMLLGGVVALAGAVEVVRRGGSSWTTATGAVLTVAAAAVVARESWLDVWLALGRGEPSSSLALLLVNGGFLVVVVGGVTGGLAANRKRLPGVAG